MSLRTALLLFVLSVAFGTAMLLFAVVQNSGTN
jgi:hypothetical protein